MNRGYIMLWRCIRDNHFWQDKPFDRGRAWVDLVMLANHKESCLWKRGIKITVCRGQVGWSERQLADRWGWSRGKVQRFIKDLQCQGQIEISGFVQESSGNLKNEHENEPQKNNITSLITIINYDKYQANEPQNGPQTGHRRATNSTMEKNVKNEKNTTTAAEEIFTACFVEKEKRLKELYPQADFDIEKETCIAHYKNGPPVVDAYAIILKWFNRIITKPKSEAKPVDPCAYIPDPKIKAKLAQYGL